jgi:hypothetical protein
MPQRDRLDGGRMDVAAGADDYILLTARDVQVARLVDPAEVASSWPVQR